jgi:hypothetical protein
MLFLPHSLDVERAQILRDLQADKISEAEAGDRLLAVDPGFAGAYIFLGNARADAGDADEAEALYWKALENGPCSPTPYLALADIRRRFPDDPVSMELTHLAIWKLALSDGIPEAVAARFRELMPKAELDFRDPGAYEELAYAIEEQIGQMTPRPERSPRLEPFRLLNRLQYEAGEGLEEETLRDLLASTETWLPVWRAALREWARRPASLSMDAISFVIATLGECSAPAGLEELLELVNYNDLTLRSHVQWAIWRIGQRDPVQTLEILRGARPAASPSTRCGIAEQIMLLPRETPGIERALRDLLEGFNAFARDEDAGFVLLAVTEALRRHGYRREAKDVLKRYEELLTKKARREVHRILDSDEGYVTQVDDLGIADFDFEDICLDRMLMEDVFDDEDEDEDEDDDIEDESGPPEVLPGRNDPCWCGSGKKYKKCHLASDQEAPQTEPGDEQGDPVFARVYGDILDCASDWHNRADLSAAHRLYFDREPEEGSDEAVMESGFPEWYLIDFRSPSTGRTLVEEYLRRRGPRLPERERLLAESLRAARFGMWEVQRVEEGEGVEMKDLFEGDTFFVHDITASRAMAPGDCDVGRIVRFEDRWQFTGNGLVLPPAGRARIAEIVEAGSSAAGQSPGEFIRAKSHIWERILTRLHRELRTLPRLVNAEGNAFEFGQAVYELLDFEAAAAALRAARMFEDVTSATEAEGTLSFGWLETGVEGPRRSYGHIRLDGRTMTLECNSRERLSIGRQLVEKHAGAFLRHVEDKFTSVEDAFKKMDGAAAPDEPAGP